MRVLIGMTEIANFVAEFTAALQTAGIEAESFVIHRSPYYPANQYTYCYDGPGPAAWGRLRRAESRVRRALARLFFLLRHVRHYDVIVFVWNNTFLPFMADLPLLRLLGKKVIVFNCGDDVRYRPIQNRLEKNLFGINRFDEVMRAHYEAGLGTDRVFLQRFFTQRMEEWSGCTIVTMRNQATFQKKPAFVFRFPVKRLLQCHREARLDRPLIVHAPTDRAVKGTAYVLEAITRLRRRGLSFTFELIEGRDNPYVLKRLLEADILIDQPSTWIGRLGSEALAASCAVIGGNLHEFEAYPEPSPVIPFKLDPEDLAASIEHLLLDAPYRASVMKDSFAFWERNYSYERFASYFMEILASTASVLPPVPQIKQHLAAHACNAFQRTVIRAFL